MAKPSNKPEATETPAPVQAAAVQPVVTLITVTYGKNETVEPGRIITPVSKRERDELFTLKAVRELTDAETALFAADADATVEVESSVEPEPIPGENPPPASEDPIG